MRLLKSIFLAILLAACSSRCSAQEITVSAAKPSGIYAIGEKIIWRIEVKGEGAAGIDKVSYLLKKGHLTEMGRGELVLQDNRAQLEAKLDEPGSILAEFTAQPADKAAIKVLAGAVIAPEKITPSAPPPQDFAKFWTSKVEELNQIPINPVVEAIDSGEAKVDLWKVTLDNVRGSKVRGQLMRPKIGKKLPALLVVQWAGVYPLNKYWILQHAHDGWLTLNINAHDLPIDAPEEFYKNLQETALKDYTNIGNDNRDTSYFLRMYLSCYRAADYLMSRPDWDGRTLVVTGASQGGLQALMLGGLHPKITGVVANIPAGADLTGPLAGRKAGWPRWYEYAQDKDPKTKEKIIETSRYYDVVNFARYIKCSTLIGVGLVDTSCPAPGIMAAFNQIKAPKELAVMEKADHMGRSAPHTEYHTRASAWLKELAKGNPAPAVQLAK